jgi:cytochrome c5
MSRSIKFSCVLIAALAFAACGDDGDGDTGGNDAGTACTPDTYANYGMAFFKTNCTLCHSAALDMSEMMNVKLDTLPGIKASKDHIIKHAVKLEMPIMPQTGALPEAERLRLEKWLNCGAP